MSRLHGIAALATMAVMTVGITAGAASATSRQASGLYDARYCEIIELKGAPPNAVATVWNTIGLNKCPAARWNAFEAGALAKELGATFVVLNGPRHFLMDSVTAETGTLRSFRGMRMRRVAAIPIRSAAELAQTPYADRTIKRENIWRWKRGRTVFELVAPGGDTYVMQSYAQIRDRDLTLAGLRRLGRRLDLPRGWRYRARRLREPLALNARGRATITQDELLNTYQLATTARRPGKRHRRKLKIVGRTRAVSPIGASIEDHGTVSGTPFGRGSIVLTGRFAGARLTGSFRLLFRRGSISGTVALPFKISDGRIAFDGSARLTGGTGAYRGITSGRLRVRDTNTLDGQSGRLSVIGFAMY